jgi:inhibitor of cysteine peptidase
MGSRLITEADHGQTVNLKKGDALTIRLPENPTTGYRWSLDEHNASVLEPSASPEFEPSGPAVGAGGARTFGFRAKAPGDYGVTLNLRRPWEKEASPAKSFAINVRVDE